MFLCRYPAGQPSYSHSPLPASFHAFLVFVATPADGTGTLVPLHSILESAASDPWVLHITSRSLLYISMTMRASSRSAHVVAPIHVQLLPVYCRLDLGV